MANQSKASKAMRVQQLDNIIKQLASSDKPEDIVTLVYIHYNDSFCRLKINSFICYLFVNK